MSRRRRTVFAAPLVLTIALAPACDKKPAAPSKPEPEEVIARNPPEPPPEPPPLTIDAGAAASPADAAIDPSTITYNGHGCLQGPPGKESSVPCPDDLLPEAKPGVAVIAQAEQCRIQGNRQVRCPVGGPTIIPPSPAAKRVGQTTTQFAPYAMACTEFQDMSCPKNATCNPPPPRPIACPDDLLPSLAPGVAPTARKGGECFLGDTEVACPTGELSGPAVTRIPDGDHVEIVWREHSKDCWREYLDDCAPGVKCNPPEPQPVACPDALLPVLVNGKSPTKKQDGTCWWGNAQVRCK